MDAEPRFPNANEARERRVLAGRLFAHVFALAIGSCAGAVGAEVSIAIVAAWALAVVGDPIAARIGAWTFDRTQPSVE